MRWTGEEPRTSPTRNASPARDRDRPKLSHAKRLHRLLLGHVAVPTGLAELENRHALPGLLQHPTHRGRQRAEHRPEDGGKRAGRGRAR